MDDRESQSRPPGNTNAARHSPTQLLTAAPQQRQQGAAQATPAVPAAPKRHLTRTGGIMIGLDCSHEYQLTQELLTKYYPRVPLHRLTSESSIVKVLHPNRYLPPSEQHSEQIEGYSTSVFRFWPRT